MKTVLQGVKRERKTPYIHSVPKNVVFTDPDTIASNGDTIFDLYQREWTSSPNPTGIQFDSRDEEFWRMSWQPVLQVYLRSHEPLLAGGENNWSSSHAKHFLFHQLTASLMTGTCVITDRENRLPIKKGLFLKKKKTCHSSSVMPLFWVSQIRQDFVECGLRAIKGSKPESKSIRRENRMRENRMSSWYERKCFSLGRIIRRKSKDWKIVLPNSMNREKREGIKRLTHSYLSLFSLFSCSCRQALQTRDFLTSRNETTVHQ